MIPPARSEGFLAGRIARSAFRALCGSLAATTSGPAEHAHHGAVWLAVKLGTLEHGKIAARFGARLLPPLSLHSARLLSVDLRPVGTCLSRSLTVASRVRGGAVALGFDPDRAPNFRPHAWLVVDGIPVIESDACPTTFTTVRVA